MKIDIHPYITFDGECENAFNFYKSIFGGEFSTFKRYSYMPPQDGMPVISEEMKQRILHIELPINDTFVLCGSDVNQDRVPGAPITHQITFVIKTETREEADRLFNELSADGKVIVPIADSYWELYVGVCTDKFGVTWIVRDHLHDKK